MYRVQAEVEIVEKSLAEQCSELAAKVQQKIKAELATKIQQKIKEDSNPPIRSKDVQKLYKEILKEICVVSKKGETDLLWFRLRFFGSWTVSEAMAIALCDLLKKEKFTAEPMEASDDPGEYYVSVSW